jgi:dipeptidyl aminopeptidase/acylaminoacyl peptidase
MNSYALSARLARPSCRRIHLLLLFALGAGVTLQPAELLLAQGGATQQSELRAMTFLDVQHLRSWGSPAISPDGAWLLHTVNTPDWEEARSQSDIWMVPTTEGAAFARRMTFTEEKNETSPGWAPDGSFFVFLSNRDAPQSAQSRNQLYLMRPGGGEAQQITSTSDGVSNYAFSPDGNWLVYRSGPSDREQLHRLPVVGSSGSSALEPGEGEKVTDHGSGVGSWEWAPDSRAIWFVAADSLDSQERLRREKGFSVEIRNMETPLASLWRVDPASGTITRAAGGEAFSVNGFTLSDDGRWVGISGGATERYRRNIQEQGLHSDLYLLETATGHVERLTETTEVSPGGMTFSPDGRWVAFSAPEQLDAYSMANRHLHIRETGNRGGAWRVLGRDFDGHISADFWSEDGNTVYFNEGIRATRQLLALDVNRDEVRQVTRAEAALSVSRDDDTGAILVTYQDPSTPSTLYMAPSVEALADRSRWTQLTDVNPQVRDFALGAQREITWTSSDGVEVGGVLTLPVGYREGTRYPLIVAIHGGPASADVLGFNGGYGSQVYAGDGYAVLKPNYRGSTNYGEAFRTGIVGNYFPPGYEDIMTGVDHLIAEGIVDGDQLGALGWSAGGHWSNWILVNTDRFKAISSGAGTSNWISMYAQSDVQRNRQFYLGDQLPYHDFDAYWDQSPLKYITRARTPTMIHVVEGDPRVPSPQSVELHMALRQLGVPTELFMYPGQTHGITQPRNRLVKSVSEKAWMDHYVRGIGEGFEWRQVLETLEASTAEVVDANGR